MKNRLTEYRRALLMPPGKNLLRKMKLAAFLLVFITTGLFATETYSQISKVSIEAQDIPLKEVLLEIEKQTDYLFIYKPNEVNLNRKTSVQATDKPVTDVLVSVLKGTDIAYAIEGSNIMLMKRTEPLQDEKKSISGIIMDETGESVIGASIIEKGTTNGVISDINGRFTIQVGNGAVLQISYIGYATTEVAVGNNTTFNIKLQESLQALDEVVVVGYGTMKKSDLTGSVVSIKMADKETAANVSLSQALQGYMAGVNVGGTSKAGEAGSISIRGNTSLSASQNPLLVVDGIIYNGSLNDFDVNDVEKVDILKDASAAAVFGSRSANGVILISTKKGVSEKPRFNFNMYYGIQSMAPTKRTKVMNGDQYAIRLADFNYYQNNLLPWYKTNPTSENGHPERPDITDRNVVAKNLRSLEEQTNYLAGNEIDWMDEVYSAAPIQNYNLSVSGNSNRTNYYLSGSWVDQDGIISGDAFKRFTLRANFENSVNDWLTLGLNTAITRLDYSGFYNSMDKALRASPLVNLKNAIGNYPLDLAGETTQRHPLVDTYIDDLEIQNRSFYVASAKVDIPFVKGLRYEVNYSETFNTRKKNDFYPVTTVEGSNDNSRGEKQITEERNWIVNNIVSYANTFNKLHSVNGTLLYSAEKRLGEGNTLIAYGFDNPVLGFNALSLGETQSVNSTAWEEASISYMARANYAYDNKYLFTATYRRDGFSGFGKNNKYANFPSVSAAWVLSQENFLNEVSWLDQLKLRLSYGINGNQGIGRYASQSQMAIAPYIYGASTAIGVYPSSMGNSDLGWESTASTNLGLNIMALDQRISAEIDVYDSQTSDVLVRRNIPQLTGYSSVWTNIGGLNNKGIEIGLTTINVKNPHFRWQSRIVFSLNRDKITELYGDGTENDLANSWFKGKPISAIYNYVVEGIWQEQDLYNGTIMPGYYPGYYKVKSLNGDNVIDATNDRQIVGYQTPNYRFGIDNTFSYKNWAFSFFINSIQGGNGYYQSNVLDLIAPSPANNDFAIRSNRPAIYSYWRPDNPVNNVPAMYYAPPLTPAYLMSRSFIRLQDVALSYNFGKALLQKVQLNSLQFYVSGKNLLILTDWPGWDPEDNNTPMMKTIIGGVRISF
jgi:TonB-linked SusC/RagA family outer membrane protein